MFHLYSHMLNSKCKSHNFWGGGVQNTTVVATSKGENYFLVQVLKGRLGIHPSSISMSQLHNESPQFKETIVHTLWKYCLFMASVPDSDICLYMQKTASGEVKWNLIK